MSGGSYDYLFVKDADNLAEHENVLEQMADRLAGLGYAEDAARETHETLLLLRQARVRLQARIDRLSGIWRAVEWWDSGDSGPSYLDEVLSQYRQDHRLGKWATRETGWCVDRDCGYAKGHDGAHSYEERRI